MCFPPSVFPLNLRSPKFPWLGIIFNLSVGQNCDCSLLFHGFVTLCLYLTLWRAGWCSSDFLRVTKPVCLFRYNVTWTLSITIACHVAHILPLVCNVVVVQVEDCICCLFLFYQKAWCLCTECSNGCNMYIDIQGMVNMMYFIIHRTAQVPIPILKCLWKPAFNLHVFVNTRVRTTHREQKGI